jgi:hypothetical protein
MGSVTILFAAQGATPPPNGMAPNGGPSQRSAIANGNTGAVVIWGGGRTPRSKRTPRPQTITVGDY